MSDWQSERRSRNERLDAGSKFAEGKMVAPGDVTALLEAVVRPGDRICLEGDNQKQADFLAACLANADPKVLHDLHVVQSGIVLPEHIDLFEKGIAKKLDYSYSGPQSYAVPRALNSGAIELGAIHTYIELFARYFVDLTPHVALTVARSADRQGNLPTRRTLPPSSKQPPSRKASLSLRSMRWGLERRATTKNNENQSVCD
jgi:malonate decarboxylase alpha subunit